MVTCQPWPVSFPLKFCSTSFQRGQVRRGDWLFYVYISGLKKERRLVRSQNLEPVCSDLIRSSQSRDKTGTYLTMHENEARRPDKLQL